MAPRINISVIGSAFLLTGCGGAVAAMGTNYGAATTVLSATGSVVKGDAKEAADHAENFGNAAKDGFYGVTDHIADWMRPSPPNPPLQPVRTSYCYSTFQDILCYRAPMPGWEHRLVAYQGTDAMPPTPAMMAVMPVHKPDPRMLPVNRVAAAKPVFATPPTDPADTDKTDDAAAKAVAGASAVPDASHEQLPDPSLTPQL